VDLLAEAVISGTPTGQLERRFAKTGGYAARHDLPTREGRRGRSLLRYGWARSQRFRLLGRPRGDPPAGRQRRPDPGRDLTELADRQLAIESAPERPDLKIDLFRRA
jgi:3-hydroxyacyl-CoA dehydrogenase